MDVWRQAIRLVECADAHEARKRSRLGIVAPDGHLALWTPRDPLPLAARGRRIDDLRFGARVDDTLGLVDGIKRVDCSSLALTPSTVAGNARSLVFRLADTGRAGRCIRLPWGLQVFCLNLNCGLILPRRLSLVKRAAARPIALLLCRASRPAGSLPVGRAVGSSGTPPVAEGAMLASRTFPTSW